MDSHNPLSFLQTQAAPPSGQYEEEEPPEYTPQVSARILRELKNPHMIEKNPAHVKPHKNMLRKIIEELDARNTYYGLL